MTLNQAFLIVAVLAFLLAIFGVGGAMTIPIGLAFFAAAHFALPPTR